MANTALEFDARSFCADRPPVLLLGGLNLVRALGLAGIPTLVGSAEADPLVFASRYCGGRLRLPSLEREGAVLDTLLAAGERLTRALGRRIPLFYGNDDFLSLVHRLREPLSRHFLLQLNLPEVADCLIDKDRFQQFAMQRRLPVPRELAWEELSSFPGPVLVKPKTRVAWEDSPVFVHLCGSAGKARVFESGPNLAAHRVAQGLKDSVVVQEYLGGDDRHLWSFHGYADEAGEVLAWLVGRKLRTDPPHTGVSTMVELEHDAQLAALGHVIVERMPLRGVFKIDVKKDPVSGAFRLLEINARFNLWHYLGAVNGLNLPAIVYRHLVYGERPATRPTYATRRRWHSLRADFRAYRALAEKGECNFAGWIASVLGKPRVYEEFSWFDPVPALKHLITRLLRVPQRMTRWLLSAS
jgi:D-aspartate ligase